ncbi:hypothetical protein AB0D66_28240 [Streptomyces sp. NPDC048270]|uniref:hypothetical protein n=1 Tax=Streptomyces sp. NPDC048270 TaxID=3154615 RepID=UPI0033CC913D
MSATPAPFDEHDEEAVAVEPIDDPNEEHPPRNPTRAAVLTRHAHKVAARERAVLAAGTRHTARQMIRWWNAQDLSTEYLAAFHLNHQHTQ